MVNNLLAAYRDSELSPRAVARAVELVPAVTGELDEQLVVVQVEMPTTETAMGRYYEAIESVSLTAEVFGLRVAALQERQAAQDHHRREGLPRAGAGEDPAVLVDGVVNDSSLLVGQMG